mmetsp:Transcript_36624/g.105537  ORF Transcript_36624/g.105537 Transcript_36624/m.105537 type:complete len:293 (+) Transcript_36624:153-1031(+)
MAAATETETQVAEVQGTPADPVEVLEWKPLPVYLARFDRFDKELLIDVLKISTRSEKIKDSNTPSLSKPCWQAKEALQEDPHNMWKINHMGLMYLKDGKHEQCLNVLLRGWKRASEIKDEAAQFAFLMKLAELSMGFWKFRQALAVFRDIREPSDAGSLLSYLILGTQVWANNGDETQALKFFRRATDSESFLRAVRVFAAVSNDLRKAGAYEAARSSMERLVEHEGDKNDLALIDEFVENMRRNAEEAKTKFKPEQVRRWTIMTGVITFIVLLLMVLTWLEARSLRAIKAR